MTRGTTSIGSLLTLVLTAGLCAGVGAAANMGSISGTARAATSGSASGSAPSAPRYVVRARNIQTGEVASTVRPELNGSYVLAELPLPGNYLIELFDEVERKVVATEGPFSLNAGTPSLSNIAIHRGMLPAASRKLLTLAGIGSAAAGVATVAVLKAGETNGNGSNPSLNTICHRAANGTLETIVVNAADVESHVAHGDTPGACPASGSR